MPLGRPIIFFDYAGTIVVRGAVVEGMEESIRELSKQFTLIIISSTTREAIQDVLREHHLLSCFADVVGYEAGVTKAEQMQHALDLYHVAKDHAFFVTDRRVDVEAAHRINVRSIAVTWGMEDRYLLNQSNPEALITKPEEIATTIDSLLSTEQ